MSLCRAAPAYTAATAYRQANGPLRGMNPAAAIQECKGEGVVRWWEREDGSEGGREEGDRRYAGEHLQCPALRTNLCQVSRVL